MLTENIDTALKAHPSVPLQVCLCVWEGADAGLKSIVLSLLRVLQGGG